MSIPHTDHFSRLISELRVTIENARFGSSWGYVQLHKLRSSLDQIEAVGIQGAIWKEKDESEFMDLHMKVKKLIGKCPELKFDLLKKSAHSKKLEDVNHELLEFFQIPSEAMVKEDRLSQAKMEYPQQKRLVVREKDEVLKRKPNKFKTIIDFNRMLPFMSRLKRPMLGWRVPMVTRRMVAFREPLEKLKAKVLAAIDDDRHSVVVVSAASGSGKTTLASMLCYLPEIQGKFWENVFYVTVSQSTNFMELVNDLFNPNPFSEYFLIENIEDAKYTLEIFLHQTISYRRPVLLVIDEVWSDSFIKNFEFKIKGYVILATSRMFFPQYDSFQLDPLSEEDAKTLFHRSAFTERGTRSSPSIDEGLVNQMVKHCNRHPLTLSLVGSSLNGKCESVWKFVLITLSEDQWHLDNKDELKRLERTIEEWDEDFQKHILDFEALDDEFKQYLLDFTLFPEHQRIPGSALLDIWVHLYDHDAIGRDTLTKIFQLSYKNLVSSVTIGEEANAIVNYCEQTFVTQQDLLRELAVHLSSKEPITQRTRLIIDAQGEDLSASIQQVNEPMQARILSVSTGESFSSRWCDMNVPEVEVLVLNITSETYTLPNFLEKMQKLKILNVTNYGLYPIELGNVHLFGSLTNLTRIRLERVAISFCSAWISALVNLEKFSLIMCKIRNSTSEKFNRSDDVSVWPRLVEIEIDHCQNLSRFPDMFCSSVHLEKLSIRNCNEICGLPEEVGELTHLQTLSIRSCTKLEKLPESITRLQKLQILDISDCLSFTELPDQIGKLGGLRMIYMKGCARVHELPSSIKELSHIQVLCDDEICSKWQEFPNVKIPVVEEDRLLAITKNIS